MNKGTKFFSYFFLILAAFLSVFPVLWMAISATNTSVDVIRGKMTIGSNLMTNLTNLLAAQPVGHALWNSLRNSVILTFLSLLVCSIAGYGFEIYHTKAKDNFMGFLLLAMMIPFAALMIPLFQMFSSLNLLDTTTGFILPTLATPFLIMFFRQSSRAFPGEIIEASRLDGLNEIEIFFRMYIPTMKSTYAAALTMTFMTAWNAYLWPKVIMLDANSVTMPMLISNLIGGYVTDYGVLMLAVLICTLPTVVIFFFLQRYFTEGVTGAVK